MPVSAVDIKNLEKFADRIFGQVGIEQRRRRRGDLPLRRHNETTEEANANQQRE